MRMPPAAAAVEPEGEVGRGRGGGGVFTPPNFTGQNYNS